METDDIAACQAGSLDRFDTLYTTHVDAIYRYIHRRTLQRSVAEDLTATVFVKAMESIRSFSSDRGSFRGWLFRIARNTVIDEYRSSAHRPVSIENVWDLPSEHLPSDDAAKALDAKKIHEALSTLKPLQREILFLRMWEGLSFADIAEITSMSEGNARVISVRALQELKKKLPHFLLFLLFPKFL